jgi:large subunit ribosomal protein L29
MKLDEIRALSDQELRARVSELQEEQFRLRFRSATETLESPLRLREVRRDIARVLTVLREKELVAEQGAGRGRPTPKARRAANRRGATPRGASPKSVSPKGVTKTAR